MAFGTFSDDANLPVAVNMLLARDALQILDPVVGPYSVLVVKLMAFRNRTFASFPYNPVLEHSVCSN